MTMKFARSGTKQIAETGLYSPVATDALGVFNALVP
ncbi:hypothetical protein QFZ53_000076 [Microbacterium natoriense]|uniref:Uncharacterized protein n=1 Tax=Microbacterium natoriense TaxID=284570 RepID=A0AAW8ER46_9MICO|nr:hypothetical protein [Microbacterium natoriense]